jgi:hypothetical protein
VVTLPTLHTLLHGLPQAHTHIQVMHVTVGKAWGILHQRLALTLDEAMWALTNVGSVVDVGQCHMVLVVKMQEQLIVDQDAVAKVALADLEL